MTCEDLDHDAPYWHFGMSKKEAIALILPKVLELKKDFGLHPSMTLAQVMQESGWLKHAPGNNFLGIKVPRNKIDTWPEDRKQLLKTTEWSAEKGWHKVYAWFVKYPSLNACMDRYAKILLLDRYKETRESKDWWDATNWVRINGYATSPVYSNSLKKLILKSKLYKYDWVHDYNEPITDNFIWGESFSNVRFNGRTYRRVIEPYPEYFNNTIAIAEEAQKGRDVIAKPFIANNWFRIESYNAFVGGVKGSQHLISLAIDLRNPRWYTAYNFYRTMRSLTDCTGYGIGKRYLHIDKKDINYVRVWYY